MKKYLVSLMILIYLILPGNARAAPSKYIEFDGVDDYIRIPHAENLNFGVNDNFTIEFWVKPDPVQVQLSRPFNFILGKFSENSKNFPYVLGYSNQQQDYSHGAIFANRADELMMHTIESTTRLNDSQWHHVAYVKRTGYVDLYIDGILDSTSYDYIFDEIRNNSDILIGSSGDNGIGTFKGEIADLRIWGQIRTPEQIIDKMNKELTGSEMGLVGYWKLDGIRNGVIKDYSVSDNHGTPYNLELEDIGDGEGSAAEVSVEHGAEVGIYPGTLSIIKPSLTEEFGNITLNGNVQETSASLGNLTVVDTRGTGEGWRVSVSATQFQEIAGAGYTLPAGSLTLKFPNNVTALSGANPILPTITADSAVIDNGAEHTIITAAEAEGLGSFEAIFPENALTLKINPAYTYVDSETYGEYVTPFESVITWSVISGP